MGQINSNGTIEKIKTMIEAIESKYEIFDSAFRIRMHISNEKI